MNATRQKGRALGVIVAGLLLAGLTASLGCEPILIPAGHKQPNPARLGFWDRRARP